MAVSLVSTGVTFPDNSTQTTAATGFGFKNRIINGAMVIDQRNAGASVTPTSGTYTLDRWLSSLTQTNKYSVEQTITGIAAPTGFTDYLAVTSSSAYSVLTGDTFLISQAIEGFNVADLGWGTADAKTVTLSFWVRSSLTGTFGGAITNGGSNRSYPYSYVISAANTWEYKTITIAGDTSGTWFTDNQAGIRVRFGLGSGATFSGTAGAWAAGNFAQPTGSTSVVGTNGATFYITGVQLEKGSTATSFDYRPYGTELQLAQRYYQHYGVGASTLGSFGYGRQTSTTSSRIFVFHPPMRATPTVANSGGSMDIPGSALSLSSIGSQYLTPNGSGFFDVNTATGGVAGGPIAIQLSTGNYFSLTSEL